MWLRPKIMAEYEMEKPKQKWADIQAMIPRVENDRALKLSEGDKHQQSCRDMADAKLCPYMTVEPKAHHNQSFKEKLDTYSQQVGWAKADCRNQISTKWQTRELKGLNINKKRSANCRMSPYNFTVVASGGQGADIYKNHMASK